MDFATVDSVCENLFSAQNFFALHERQLNKQNYIEMVSTAIEDLENYRMENGGGDARGSLLITEDYNLNDVATATDAAAAATTTAAAAVAAATDATTGDATMGVLTSATGAELAGGSATATARDKDDTTTTSTTTTNALDFDLLTMMGYCPPNDWTERFRVPRPAPSIQIGEEIYALRLDTIFVLNMRQNVTKNDIIVFFGKMGRIKIDELTMKPKIFVYKNKLTGRSKGEATITYTNSYAAQAAIQYLNGSKFLGQVLNVVPAYLSTRPGKSVRFSYAQETGIEQQRRQRQKKWKPAYDNWVCELCRNSNFVWRMTCNRCRVSKSDAAAMSSVGQTVGSWRPKKHDWNCGYCFNVNFWYRQKCNRCRAPKSELNNTNSESTDTNKWELDVSQTEV